MQTYNINIIKICWVYGQFRLYNNVNKEKLTAMF